MTIKNGGNDPNENNDNSNSNCYKQKTQQKIERKWQLLSQTKWKSKLQQQKNQLENNLYTSTDQLINKLTDWFLVWLNKCVESEPINTEPQTE